MDRPTSLRPNDTRLLTGRGRYVADLGPADRAAMAVVRSRAAHGRVVEVETQRARALPGVLGILTAKDLHPVPTIPIRSFARPGMERRLQPVLATERVRYVGEPVTVVIAEDRRVAEDAAERVHVEIDPLPAVSRASLDEPAPDDLLCRWVAGDGGVDEAFAAARVVVSEDFSTQRHSGVPLETRGLLARWDGDGLELWGPTKFLAFTRRAVAEWFGLAPERVRIHRVDVGGMFGVRGELYPEDFLVPWAARAVGRPVEWIEDRHEHLVATNHGREVSYRYELAASETRLLAFRARAAVDMGAYVRPAGGRVPLLAIEELPGPYAWRAFEAVCDGVATNKTPIGTVRGPSALESTFVRERAIDLAAARLGIDPVELRRRSLIDGGGRPFRRSFGDQIHAQTLEPTDYRGLFERFLAAAGYPERRAAAARRRDAGEAAGVGVACFLAHSGLGEEEHATVSLRQDGRFEVRTTATEVGQGIDSVLRRVAHEALGVDPEAVDVRSGGTVDAPDGRGTFASRSTVFAGGALHDACEHLLEQARTKAAKDRDVDPSRLRAGPEGLSDEDGTIPWVELAPLEADGIHRAQEAIYGFGAHLAEVEVDSHTWLPVVRRLAVGYDCGRPIDPEGVRDQLVGATVQAFGGTVLEELAYDETAQPLSTTFMDYLLPSAAEAPAVEAITFGLPSASNPLGARGAGEAGVLGVAGAIANAIGEATGRCDDGLTELPLGPCQLYEQLGTQTEPPEEGGT